MRIFLDLEPQNQFFFLSYLGVTELSTTYTLQDPTMSVADIAREEQIGTERRDKLEIIISGAKVFNYRKPFVITSHGGNA